MLRHIESQLPSKMHLPVSSTDTLHFYWYLNTHMLIGDRQSLLLIDVPIQDRAQQLQTYRTLYLPIPHDNVSAQYKINNKHIGVTYDEMQAVMITQQQYSTCLHENGQFCKTDVPFQALTNQPTYITALYANNDQEIGIQCSLSIFHTPPAFLLAVIMTNL